MTDRQRVLTHAKVLSFRTGRFCCVHWLQSASLPRCPVACSPSWENSRERSRSQRSESNRTAPIFARLGLFVFSRSMPLLSGALGASGCDRCYEEKVDGSYEHESRSSARSVASTGTGTGGWQCGNVAMWHSGIGGGVEAPPHALCAELLGLNGRLTYTSFLPPPLGQQGKEVF